jgi:prolyl oligopeptidase
MPTSHTPSHTPPVELTDTDDLYLEEIEGAEARAWVEARRPDVTAELEADPAFEQMRLEAAERLETPDRLPFPELHGPWVYNFWRDPGHVRGLWRRTSWDGYRAPEPTWEVILDVDRLVETEKENWVFLGTVLGRPENDRALVFLSRGGRDAGVVREFSLRDRAFVSDGFRLPEAKTGAAWAGDDKIAVSTSHGPDTVTTSGYPRQIRLWQRGEPIASARVLMECERDEVMVWPSPLEGVPGFRVLCLRRTSFFHVHCVALRYDDEMVPVAVPETAVPLGGLKGRLLFLLRDGWTPEVGALAGQRLPGGTVIATRLAADPAIPERELVYAPASGESVQHGSSDPHTLYLVILRDVRGVVLALRPPLGGADPAWSCRELELPALGQVDLASVNPHSRGAVVVHTGFLTPNAFYFTCGEDTKPEPLRAEAPRFDASGLEVSQNWTTSRDGTRIPYFVVGPKGSPRHGTAPTILTGYGGFRISRLPDYDPVRGRLWLEGGGLWVVANLRGGGEFGPDWHRAALRENRPRAYEDFEAVAEDLIRRHLTRPDQLGILGGSNGGLLVGAAITRRPELFRAAYCRNPLLDMLRFAQLSAGRSWIEEYGDPEQPEDRVLIRTWSPYHQVKPGVNYPKVLFVTSTIDDRVHPGHARRMAERLRRLGQPILYFENTEGGHSGVANLKQAAWVGALGFLFFRKELGLVR